MKIKIIGQYPPPIGGISIHILRLTNLLFKEGFDLEVYDDHFLRRVSIFVKLFNLIRGSKKTKVKELVIDKYNIQENVKALTGINKFLLKLMFYDRKSDCIIHYHTKDWKNRALLCLTSLINSHNKILLTIHSLRDNYAELSFKEKLYLKFSLKYSDHLIVTNSHIRNKLVEWGTNEGKISIIAPFLPPEEIKKDFEQIPERVWQFISDHNPIVSANAFKIRFYKEEDLYGIDMCIKLCEKLLADYPNIGFLFSLPSVGNKEYFNRMRQIINKKKLNESFKFLTKPYAFYPILKHSSIFVRPTNTDGDALSIREALEFNVPVVASNVVERPAGTVIFNNRDDEDFYIKVKNVLNNLQDFNIKLQQQPRVDNFAKTINIYKSLVNKNI